MKTKIGIIGCGNISAIYFQNLKKLENTEVAACADIVMDKARARAEEFGIPQVLSVEALLKRPDIKIILNLTIPKAHAEVAFKALHAGKSVYNEKPLTITRADGKKLLALARKKRLLVGGAPDTFMGGGIQTCRKLIDDGWIGKPVAATAFMMCHGHESWHPDPEFYYKNGGGPLFDMGPYYLTALVNLIGPVRRVSGFANITFPERRITSQPKYGKKIKVETPTHIAGTMEFENNALCTLVTSFDVWGHHMPHIEIHGTLGSLSVPDPNTFGGPVLFRSSKAPDWNPIPIPFKYTENSRGIGVADMAEALSKRGKPRASGELTYHVLDVMHSFLDSAKAKKHIAVQSTCQKPAALSV
jgi:predicted dehydrogenase